MTHHFNESTTKKVGSFFLTLKYGGSRSTKMTLMGDKFLGIKVVFWGTHLKYPKNDRVLLGHTKRSCSESWSDLMTLHIKQPVQANMFYKKSEDVPFPSTLVPVCTWMTSMIDCWFREMEFWDCVHRDWRRVLHGSVLIEFQTTAINEVGLNNTALTSWMKVTCDRKKKNVCISHMHT